MERTYFGRLMKFFLDSNKKNSKSLTVLRCLNAFCARLWRMTASYGPRLLPTMLIMKDVPIRMCRHFWGAWQEQNKNARHVCPWIQSQNPRGVCVVCFWAWMMCRWTIKSGQSPMLCWAIPIKGGRRKTPGSHGNSHRCSASAL